MTAPRHFDPATAEQGDVVSRNLDQLHGEESPCDIALALVVVHMAIAHLASADAAHAARPSKGTLASQWRARFMRLQAERHYDDLLEIEGIGPLQIGHWLRPCMDGLAVYRGDERIFHVPRGTSRSAIETALRIHDDAYSAGHGAGRAAAMADFRAFIGEPA